MIPAIIFGSVAAIFLGWRLAAKLEGVHTRRTVRAILLAVVLSPSIVASHGAAVAPIPAWMLIVWWENPQVGLFTIAVVWTILIFIMNLTGTGGEAGARAPAGWSTNQLVEGASLTEDGGILCPSCDSSNSANELRCSKCGEFLVALRHATEEFRAKQSLAGPNMVVCPRCLCENYESRGSCIRCGQQLGTHLESEVQDGSHPVV